MKKSVLLFFICIMFMSCLERETYKVRYELVNLGDYEGTAGAFFLGCGTIGTELYYIGYIRVYDGIKRIKIHNSAIIHYTKKQPIIGVIYKSWNEPNIKKDLHNIESGVGWDCDTQIHIYIPEGSIKENYSLGE